MIFSRHISFLERRKIWFLFKEYMHVHMVDMTMLVYMLSKTSFFKVWLHYDMHAPLS